MESRDCPEFVKSIELMPTLGAWRVTQGIYRFEPTLFDALCDTPVVGELPREVLFRMPEWCVYIMTPGLQVGLAPVHGAFVYLDWDMKTQCPGLHIVLNLPSDVFSRFYIPLIFMTLERALSDLGAKSMRYTSQEVVAAFAGFGPGAYQDCLTVIQKITALLLYICTQNAELSSGPQRPQNPTPTRTRKGFRTFPAERATTWDVGTRLGSALRTAYARADEEAANSSDETRASPRAHIRRAHYHHFWTGPLGSSDRRLTLKWLPPIAVNLERLENLASTIRPVESLNDHRREAA